MVSLVLIASILRNSVGISTATTITIRSSEVFAKPNLNVIYKFIIKCVLLIRVIIFVCRLLHIAAPIRYAAKTENVRRLA